MKRISYKLKANQGFTLFFAVLVAAILLSIGAAILNVGLREVQLSGTGRDSQFAFYAADTGIECALYWDIQQGAFGTDSSGTIQCNDQTFTVGGQPVSTFTITFPPFNYCTEVRVDKSDSEKTTVEARGYNTCVEGARRLERGIRTAYANPTSPSSTTGSPTITNSAIAGTNANSSEAESVSLSYNHPGGAMLVFFRHAGSGFSGDVSASGHSVTFNGQNISILDTTTGIGTVDNRPFTGLAYLDNVSAANDTVTVSWSGDQMQRGLMVFSIDEASMRGFNLARFGHPASPEVTIGTESGDLVIAGMTWRNSAIDVTSSSGQTLELNDDSPTRQQADSKVGSANSTTLSWTTTTGTGGGNAFNIYAVSFANGSGDTASGDIQRTTLREYSDPAHQSSYTDPTSFTMQSPE